MERLKIKTINGNYNCWYSKGTKNNNVAILYYHGLGGRAKIVQPLLKEFGDFDFYSIDERGHIDSLQPPSISIKKHDKDITSVIDILKHKYTKIFLCGESMGGLFVARQAYQRNDIDGVFCWSIPFHPKNIMQKKKNNQFLIFSKVFISFFFGKNFAYKSTIDYPKLTNSKLLMKLHELDIETTNNTAEEVVTWKGSLSIKSKFLNKNPLSPVYYWQGEKDIMSNQRILNKIIHKNKIKAFLIPNAKHILMFETEGKEMIKEIKKIIETTLL